MYGGKKIREEWGRKEKKNEDEDEDDQVGNWMIERKNDLLFYDRMCWVLGSFINFLNPIELG